MAQGDRISVLVLHEDPVVRAGLSSTFQKYADLEVVNPPDEVKDMQSAEASLSGTTADVVVADYRNGMAAATHSSRRKVMIVAACDRESEIRSSLQKGVRGFVLTGGRLDDLAEGVRAVHHGARHLSPRVADRLAESLSAEALTQRELEVVRLVMNGSCNKTIGRRLGIAVGTVKSHLRCIFDKLQVDSRTQAISVVERRGLLQFEH